MGQNLNRDGGVTHFNDLGVYRYLYKIARMDDLRDMYQDQVARIASYDHRKGTDLLDTLETYLECAGNLTKTSNRLFVHRNTLIQRLERLQSLCEIDLQERSNWLTLQVAIKGVGRVTWNSPAAFPSSSSEVLCATSSSHRARIQPFSPKFLRSSGL